MVDIVVGHIPPVQNDPNRRNDQGRSPPREKKNRERRKTEADRRQSVREGIVVTLSHQVERRQGSDRRKG